MTFPDVFSTFFCSFWFCGLLRGGGFKRQKWPKILSHFVSQELYLIWLWFLVHMCKIMISPANFFVLSKVIFPVFQNSSINAKRKFWGVPHLPHMCVIFFVKLWLILSQLELSRTELPKCTPNILMEKCDHTIYPVLSILFYMTRPIRLGFLKHLSLS